RQEDLSGAVRRVMEGQALDPILGSLRKAFPEDEVLRGSVTRDALLEHLAETYSLSNHLLRNRRAVVGGFSERRLHRHRVVLTEAERAARKQVHDALGTSGELRGAPLAGLLRRLDSSPAAFRAAVPSAPPLPDRDAKQTAFQKLLESIWKEEPSAKV